MGLLLADQHDYLHYMAASRESARLLELFQLQNDKVLASIAFGPGSLW